MKRPIVWFPLGVLLLMGGGAWGLAHPVCCQAEERERDYFTTHLYAQTAFDALSAVCGAGLLTRRLDTDYTEAGRWLLCGLSAAGALLYVAALAITARRIGAAPSVRAVLLGLTILIALSAAAFAGAAHYEHGAADWAIALRRAVGVAASGGIFEGTWSDSARTVAALTAWASALGWGVWLLAVSSWRARMGARRMLGLALGYSLFLAALAGLVLHFDGPRGSAGGGARADPRAASAGWPERAARAAVLVSSAAGAGVCPEPLDERGVSEPSRIVLALAVLTGGLAGGPGGGIRFPLLIVAGAAAWGALRAGRLPDPETARWQRGCLGGVLALGALTLFTALGLLAIEQATASRFQPAPSAADALLEAASAVGGASLTSGLTASVTSRNLVSGIGLGVSHYQFGMALMMLAMLAGRVLPLLVLWHASESPNAQKTPPAA